jgi:hypothetical protein
VPAGPQVPNCAETAVLGVLAGGLAEAGATEISVETISSQQVVVGQIPRSSAHSYAWCVEGVAFQSMAEDDLVGSFVGDLFEWVTEN